MKLELTHITSFIGYVCVGTCMSRYTLCLHVNMHAFACCGQKSTFGFVPWVLNTYIFVYSLILRPGLLASLGLSGCLDCLARNPQVSDVSTSPKLGLLALIKMSIIKKTVI